jgi:hypothetical protein
MNECLKQLFHLIYDKIIEKIYIATDQSELIFILKDSSNFIKLILFADCCSESWVADIIGLNSILGTQVKTIGEIPYSVINILESEYITQKRSRQDMDKLWSFFIGTVRKRDCTFIFRNSSNGYYGGSLDSAIIVDSWDINSDRLYRQLTNDEYRF